MKTCASESFGKFLGSVKCPLGNMMCTGKTQTLGTDNVMVLVRLLLLLSSREHPIFARRNITVGALFNLERLAGI